MASTVNVPLLGTHSKGAVVGVAVGGAALAGYMIYHSRKAKQAASAAAATQTAQAASGYGYGADYPGGFYGYGSPGQMYGYGASGGFQPTGYYGYGTPTPSPGPQPIAATTNAQWAQAAINQLTQDGYDPQTVAGALGAYELGQPVPASQQSIVQAAIGVEGYPPQSGANGYPPAINVQGTSGGGGGGGQGSGQITVPNVVGDRADVARPVLRRAGLAYNISDNATGKVTSQSPRGGTKVNAGSTVSLTLRAW